MDGAREPQRGHMAPWFGSPAEGARGRNFSSALLPAFTLSLTS